MLDILISGGQVYDGTGNPPMDVDVGILGDKIVLLELTSDVNAQYQIDASGLAISPGFIDMHSHADYTLPVLPTADSKIHQGFTLEVVGNCGSSPAPLDERTGQEMIASTSEGGTNMAWPGMGWDWSSFGEYLDRIDRIGIAINVIALVGHAAIRRLVMGNEESSPDQGQLTEMANQLRKAMDEGAIGFSTGLVYPPGSNSSTEEIIALAKVAAEKQGLYTSHIRGEGDHLLKAIDEAIVIGEKSGISVQISHLKAMGQSNWDKLKQGIDLIQDAIDHGMDVSADKYPYRAMNTNIISLLPAWAQSGGIDRIVRLLLDEDTRSKIRGEIAAPDISGQIDWNSIKISYCPKVPQYEGNSFEEIARAERKHVSEVIMDLAIDTRGQVELIAELMSLENLSIGLNVPWVMICTDGEGRSIKGLLSRGKPHPRNFGTTAKWLGFYIREKHLVPLEDAIHRMTGLPAAKLKLDRRGSIRKGNFADITIFDPDRIEDLTTYKEPHKYPHGIPWVIVNGEVVIEDGVFSGSRPGRILGR